jgi:RNA polymerase-binding transcription factor DksA
MPVVKRKKSHEDEFRELLMAKRDELQARIEQRRAEILTERDPDDEGAQALQSVSSDLAVTNMEREVRTLAEIEFALHACTRSRGRACAFTVPVAHRAPARAHPLLRRRSPRRRHGRSIGGRSL